MVGKQLLCVGLLIACAMVAARDQPRDNGGWPTDAWLQGGQVEDPTAKPAVPRAVRFMRELLEQAPGTAHADAAREIEQQSFALLETIWSSSSE